MFIHYLEHEFSICLYEYIFIYFEFYFPPTPLYRFCFYINFLQYVQNKFFHALQSSHWNPIVFHLTSKIDTLPYLCCDLKIGMYTQ